MTTLIVYESLFGNTGQIARAVADGVGAQDAVELVHAGQAPDRIPDDVTLLVVGGPTHAFSMTRPGTRSDAVAKGAAAEQAGSGIREWIDRVEPRSDVRVVTLDTRVPVRMMPGSAAKSAAKALRARGFRRVERGETFWVTDTDGPLKDGEVERARTWAGTLVR